MSQTSTSPSTTPSLQQLVQDARSLALAEPVAEVARQMQICNACRYCEGFCAVFPAMTRRLTFNDADVHYLANLCHNCGACLHACQYAPPHEFAVNVPRVMARVRLQTYTHYAWPRALGALYERNGLTVALAAALSLSVFLLLTLAATDALWRVPVAQANFYSLFPHNTLVALFAPVFVWAVLALGLGVRQFWRDVNPGEGKRTEPGALPEAVHHAMALTYLDGGHGEGCHNDDDGWTKARRRFHHATFYGFALCFASTSVATLYHYVGGAPAPYDLPSLPKILGALGGVSLAVGTLGLWRLNLRRHPQHGDVAQKPMDRGFIALLFLTATTGLGLWAVRGSVAMPALLAVHLGVVMALFLTLPYGKFAHGIFRSAALLKWAVEKRRPNPVTTGSD